MITEGEQWRGRVRSSKALIDTSTYVETESHKGVFLGHAFSILLKEGSIAADNPYRLKLEWMMAELRGRNLPVHCALEREQWGEKIMPPTTAIELDFNQVSKAGVLLTYPQDSPGADLEIGAALANQVPLVIVWRGNFPFNRADFTEEQRSIFGAIDLQQNQGIPSTIIYDNSTSLEEFEFQVFPQILHSLDDIGIS